MDGGHSLPAGAGVQAQTRSAAETVFPQAFRPPPIHERHGQRANKRPTGKVGGLAKRLFDIAVSAGALLVLSPFLAGIWLAVRIESPGPGFFRQRRGGFQGRPFYICKFRTMRTCESRTIAQVKQDDDRTTRLGKFLRRNSIDELPQLINVLLGDMSIVGPRPHALAHDRQFSTIDRRYAGRHHARPGITGLAQVSGSRGPTDTREKIMQRMEHDLRYVANWSWRMDFDIMIRTAMVVVRDRNATF
jgi:putative colanic acid biosysnthesis UDP-glucose lipid carrier transferase